MVVGFRESGACGLRDRMNWYMVNDSMKTQLKASGNASILLPSPELARLKGRNPSSPCLCSERRRKNAAIHDTHHWASMIHHSSH